MELKSGLWLGYSKRPIFFFFLSHSGGFIAMLWVIVLLHHLSFNEYQPPWHYPLEWRWEFIYHLMMTSGPNDNCPSSILDNRVFHVLHHAKCCVFFSNNSTVLLSVHKIFSHCLCFLSILFVDLFTLCRATVSSVVFCHRHPACSHFGSTDSIKALTVISGFLYLT